MRTNIYATFDHQDLAELAMGRLRSSVNGIYDIEYLRDYQDGRGDHTGATNAVPIWGMGWAGDATNHFVGVQPAPPVVVRISCDDRVQPQVVSKLVNLHAYKIVSGQ